MIFYKIKGKIVLSEIPRDSYDIISEAEAKETEGVIFSLTNMDPRKSRRCFSVSDPSLLFLKKEGLELLKNREESSETNLPQWILDKIHKRELKCINATFPNWEDCLNETLPQKWRINIAGLGDVGGNLAAGLRLMASENIFSIGIYDTIKERISRWQYEAGQTLSPSKAHSFPAIIPLEEKDLFNCDIFVFCVSVGVPEVGKEPEDVRIAQFEGNAKILKHYSRLARESNYRGMFIVMSDPVDLLCNIAYNFSNMDENNIMDFKGLAPEQVRGYGLGVMHGRAAYFAEKYNAPQYLTEGRCFGPHGEGVVVADSIKNYKEDISDFLTLKTKNANLDVRSFGFKPYIAPAFSSGVLSFIETINGNWHYSATSIGGVFMGSMNRVLASGVELEIYDFPENLYRKLENTYSYLRQWYEKPIFHE